MPNGRRHSPKRINSIQNGEGDLFDQCFREFYPSLCQFAQSYLKDHEASADLVQECFLKLWETGTLDDKVDHLQSFLYASVRNACIDVIRSNGVREKRVGEYTYLANHWNEEEISELTRSETIRQLHEAIERLSPEMKEIVRRRYFEGQQYVEIAKAQDATFDRVRKQGARAVRILKGQIKPLVLLWFYLVAG